MDILKSMEENLLLFGSGPTLAQMPQNTLADKLINGPTAAHRIEEIHTPLNLAYITCTTGSSAFQNIVGVTQQEIPQRIKASKRALDLAGITKGDTVVITYPPLVNVFTKEVFQELEINLHFIKRPSRDALLIALCKEKPKAVIGESSFLRATLVDAKRLGLLEYLPHNLSLIAAGTPLDSELALEMESLKGATLHDLYGCQEFGWLVMDGIPLREDITLWDYGSQDKRQQLIVGGIATGDCFLIGKNKLNPNGTILTESCKRSPTEPETTIIACTANDKETVFRTARSILRIKGRIVRVAEDVALKSNSNAVKISLYGNQGEILLEGDKTKMLEALLEAQKAYQREAKNDPVWNKKVK